MKRIAALMALSLTGGVGIGVGQGLINGQGMPAAWAQSAGPTVPSGNDEQTVIRVARDVRPAVVQIKRDGGTGSGIVIRRDGVVLTNAHVVGTAKDVTVNLASGKSMPGHVVGVDPSVDVAIVRV